MIPIFTSLSPNVEPVDRHLAWSVLLRPWTWKGGGAIAQCEQWFRNYFNTPSAWSVNSGRSGLLLILQALGIGTGDRVLLQAFTCNAVPNPVLWCGAQVVYVDIDEDSLNMDPDDLEKKMTPDCKAIIVQHTFGYPADMDRIMRIARTHHVFVIEDCAHALGATCAGKKLGGIGDAAFFSFGRDKVISSIYGGMVIAKDPEMIKKFDALYGALRFPPRLWTLQQVWHPLFMDIARRWYYSFGKFLLVGLQKLHILSLAVQKGERQGRKPWFFPRRLPNALAILAREQLERLEHFNAHRRTLANFYRTHINGPYTHLQTKHAAEAIFLRYTLRSKQRDYVLQETKKHRIMLGKWYLNPIAPETTHCSNMQYVPGSCPTAERLAQEVFNLPTHINVYETGARRIVSVLQTIART